MGRRATPLSAVDDSAARRAFLDGAGHLLDPWRAAGYQGAAGRYPGGQRATAPPGLLTGLAAALLPLVDATLQRCRRDDGLFHSYNLVNLAQGGAEVDTLYLMLRHDFGDAAIIERIMAAREHAVHPAVIRHHSTGKPCLFVGNAYVQRVHGFETELSEPLIKLANEMSKIPEIQVRHQWEPGDVALWDNFGTTHYGVSADIGTQLRRLYRVASWSEKVAPTAWSAAA